MHMKKYTIVSNLKFVKRRKQHFLKIICSLVIMIIFVHKSTHRKMHHHNELEHGSWNDTVKELFPYEEEEEQEAALIIRAFHQMKDFEGNKMKGQHTTETRMRPKKKAEKIDFKRLENYGLEGDALIPEPLPPLTGCPSSGVLLMDEDKGELGSIMTQYATVYGVARMDSKYAFVPSKTYRLIKNLFPDISMQTFNDVQKCKLTFRETDIDRYERTKNSGKRKYFETLNFRFKRDANRAQYYHKLKPELIKEFSVRSGRRKKHVDIIQNYKKDAPNKKVIGIYVDMEDFESLEKTSTRPKFDFIERAIQHFLDKYEDVVFLIRCSSVLSCKVQLLPRIEKYHYSRTPRIDHVGDGETWNYLDDFILMTLVDHLILLRNPISWWMAYLNPNKELAVIPSSFGSMYGNMKTLHLDWIALDV